MILELKKLRVIAILAYGSLLFVIQALVIRTGMTPNENSIWLYNGLASLLFGSRLLNPYFTPPADAATNAFAAMSSLIAASLVINHETFEYRILVCSIVVCGLILITALIILIARPAYGLAMPGWMRVADQLVRGVGAPNVLFSLMVVECVWFFHRSAPLEVFAILSSIIVLVVLRPIEGVFHLLSLLVADANGVAKSLGVVAAYQSPDVVLVRQSDQSVLVRGATVLVAGTDGTWLLGIALNYVGRDEGNLLRLITTRLPPQLAGFAPKKTDLAVLGGIFALDVPMEQRRDIAVLHWIERLCGIVDSDTSAETLRFEVIDERGLFEGRLVEARIGDHRDVLFQLLDGVTHEDIVQQKNKYGYARATAKKIGRWDGDQRKFKRVDWLPRINAPVFLKEETDFTPNRDYIGHFPKTSFGVSVDVDKAITHNTAILGILGIGKTYLAAELLERAIAKGIKIICLDLTNQYSGLLRDFVDAQSEGARMVALGTAAAAGVNVVNQNGEFGGSRRNFKAAVEAQLKAFVAANNNEKITVINPSQFVVTKQTSKLFAGSAELTTLTPCEIAAIVSDAALVAAQELGMHDSARICLVYEEAHSLVPEWNSVAADGDKQATATSARAILQGRKYGLGCLLITQRTANITKTILNQCNSVFAMRTFDDTGKDFLANYIGAAHASILPSLQERHAVFFGRASSCENPVLLKLNDRADFVQTFRPVADEA